MDMSACKRLEGVIRFPFPEDLQIQGGLIPALIHLTVHSTDSLLLVTDHDLQNGRSPIVISLVLRVVWRRTPLLHLPFEFPSPASIFTRCLRI